EPGGPHHQAERRQVLRRGRRTPALPHAHHRARYGQNEECLGPALKTVFGVREGLSEHRTPNTKHVYFREAACSRLAVTCTFSPRFRPDLICVYSPSVRPGSTTTVCHCPFRCVFTMGRPLLSWSTASLGTASAFFASPTRTATCVGVMPGFTSASTFLN